ncbi:MFS general substrate transporter [Cystobasidium minutum MCA 4210]|uniref:MFS general substrate transporter n=1 Tax=Cystobasidium minutum MCA 4210 TaxID=1397322 RepID=UPI0034CF4A84|eukprot:jgi/Rhomi1/142786/e_gw1.3.1413.1
MTVAGAGRAATPVDESTPLLRSKSPTTEESQDKPLPKDQLFLLCLASLVEPVAFFSIFPFVNQMIEELGVPPEHCGFYTGAVESLFSFVQFLIMPIWGRYSDKHGRKPLLIQSLFGLAITSTLFGFSRSIWQMILFRCLSGLFSGSTVTIRTMVSEISTPKTQARAFSLFAFSGNISILLSPLMGGLLAKPADNFALFRHVKLFQAYPYLLPCMVTGSLALLAATINLIFLKEVCPHLGDESELVRENLTVKEILGSDGVRQVLLIYLWTFSIAFAYTALAPVFWFTPIELGGYGFTPQKIAYLLAIGGFGQAIWTLLVFPLLHRRVGSVGVLKGAAVGWCVMFCVYSAVNLALRKGLSEPVFWTLAIACALIGSAISMSFTSVQLCLNDISPSPSSLGTLNGIALSGMALTRSVAPVVATSIFAFGVSRQILWGQLAWLVLFFFAAAYNVAVRYLPRKAWGMLDETVVDHRDEEENV